MPTATGIASRPAAPAGRSQKRRRHDAVSRVARRQRDRRRGDTHCQGEAERAAHLPACFPSPATALTLPRLNQIPALMHAKNDDFGLLHMAEGLLDCGVLQSSDWQGDILASLHCGLVRWINLECGCAELRCVNLEFGYTDDIDVWGMSPHIQFLARNDKEAVGGFALSAVAYKDFFTERAVVELNQKSRGLGYAMLSLVCGVLQGTIGAATPMWVYDTLCEDELTNGTEYTDEEMQEMGRISSTTFQQFVPEAVYSARWDYAVAEQALRKRKNPLSEAEKQMVREAIELARRFEVWLADRDSPDHYHHFEDARPVIPFGIRWNSGDCMDQTIDEYHDILAQSEETYWVWLHGFQYHGEQTLAKAVDSLKRGLDLLVRADRLLYLLDGDSAPLPPVERKRRKRGTPLAEIFAAEAQNADPLNTTLEMPQ